MSPPTTRAELAAAIRAVNAAYARLSPSAQDEVHLVSDAPLDAALLSGDRATALSAIETWRDSQVAAIEEADR